jgi:hypothetical protein
MTDQQIARAYISGGGRIEANGKRFRVDVNNYGQTVGELIEIRWSFCSFEEIPPSPVYDHTLFYFDRIAPGSWNKGIAHVDVPDIPDVAVFGRFYYRDIFHYYHSSGFILKVLEDGDTSPVRAPATYWDDHPETQLLLT